MGRIWVVVVGGLSLESFGGVDEFEERFGCRGVQ